MWGPWGAPMSGFGWVFPLIGLLICLVFVVVMARAMGGRGFMCMGDHRNHLCGIPGRGVGAAAKSGGSGTTTVELLALADSTGS